MALTSQGHQPNTAHRNWLIISGILIRPNIIRQPISDAGAATAATAATVAIHSSLISCSLTDWISLIVLSGFFFSFPFFVVVVWIPDPGSVWRDAWWDS